MRKLTMAGQEAAGAAAAVAAANAQPLSGPLSIINEGAHNLQMPGLMTAVKISGWAGRARHHGDTVQRR